MTRVLDLWRGVLLSLALVLVTTPARAAEEVSVDMSKLDDASYARIDGLGLHERLVLRLVQEGFAVVESGEGLTVTLYGTPDAVRIVVGRQGGAELEREVPYGGAPSDELHLEVIQKVVTLARRLVEPAPKPSTPEPSAPEPAQNADAAQDDDGIELELGIGAMVRRGGADVTPRFGARFPVGGDFGVIVDASITPAGIRSLEILEWQLLGGLGYRVPLAASLPLDVGAAIGVRFHHYSLPEADSRGTAVDFSAALPVSLSWFVVDAFALRLRAVLGVASSERQHTAFGESLWRRGLVRGVFGGGIAVRF